MLAEDGIVIEGASVSPMRLGRPATELSIQQEAFVVLGVQIGVGSVQLGIVDLCGVKLHDSEFQYDESSTATEVTAQAARFLTELVKRSAISWTRVLGVGLAVPGPVDREGRRILLPINLQWRDVPVADMLESLLDVPVVVDHNVRSMALAEARFGAGRGCESVAFVYLRTGLGAGLIVEGQPFSGGVRGAIELGHLQVISGGDPCVCGGVGCAETVLSGPALLHRAARLGVPTSADTVVADLWNANQTGRIDALEINAIVAPLSQGLAAIVNLLNPEVILLGGALALAPSGFIERVIAQTSAAVFPLIRSAVRIETSQLGLNAGVLGGATAALDRFFYD